MVERGSDVRDHHLTCRFQSHSFSFAVGVSSETISAFLRKRFTVHLPKVIPPMIILRNLALVTFAVWMLHDAAAASEEGVVSRINRQPVVSSNVASIGYSRRLHALEVEFTRGAIYRFLDVPRAAYRELMASDSKGHFIAERLRGRYRFVRVRSGEAPSHHRVDLRR